MKNEVVKGQIDILKYVLENSHGGGDWRRVIALIIDKLEKGTYKNG